MPQVITSPFYSLKGLLPSGYATLLGDALDTIAVRFSAFPGRVAFGTLPEGAMWVSACSNSVCGHTWATCTAGIIPVYDV